MPAPLSRACGRSLQVLSPATWDAIFSPLPAHLRPTFLGDKIHKAAALATAGSTEKIYRRVIAQWPEPADVLPTATEPAAVWDDANIAHDLPDASARIRYFDMMQYLPDDILTKVDRASMAVSLEARVPLLDHRVVEYAWRVPRSALIQGSQGKVLLRTCCIVTCLQSSLNGQRRALQFRLAHGFVDHFRIGRPIFYRRHHSLRADYLRWASSSVRLLSISEAQEIGSIHSGRS